MGLSMKQILGGLAVGGSILATGGMAAPAVLGGLAAPAVAGGLTAAEGTAMLSGLGSTGAMLAEGATASGALSATGANLAGAAGTMGANVAGAAGASQAAGAAASGGGIMEMLNSPGVGKALQASGQALSMLFDSPNTESADFQAKLAAKTQRESMATNQLMNAENQVGNAIQAASQSEGLGQQGLGGSLNRFFQ